MTVATFVPALASPGPGSERPGVRDRNVHGADERRAARQGAGIAAATVTVPANGSAAGVLVNVPVVLTATVDVAPASGLSTVRLPVIATATLTAPASGFNPGPGRARRGDQGDPGDLDRNGVPGRRVRQNRSSRLE